MYWFIKPEKTLLSCVKRKIVKCKKLSSLFDFARKSFIFVYDTIKDDDESVNINFQPRNKK